MLMFCKRLEWGKLSGSQMATHQGMEGRLARNLEGHQAHYRPIGVGLNGRSAHLDRGKQSTTLGTNLNRSNRKAALACQNIEGGNSK